MRYVYFLQATTINISLLGNQQSVWYVQAAQSTANSQNEQKRENWLWHTAVVSGDDMQ
jgi:hypothetical protein